MRTKIAMLLVVLSGACGTELPSESSETAQASSLAARADTAELAGTWTGDSYDTTWQIPGELTAVFVPRTQSTFTGMLYAVYDPELNPSQTCEIISGSISSSGAVLMTVQCDLDGYAQPEAATLSGQLSADRKTLSGTFRGAYRDRGTFTLTRP